MKPYAIYLLARFKAGESAEQLAVREHIPIDRIKMRLAAAAKVEQTHARKSHRTPETKVAA